VTETLSAMIAGNEPIDLSLIKMYARKYPELKVFLTSRNDPAKMRMFAEDVIEARFERVDGVANSNVFGGQEKEFRIVVNPARLAAHKLTIADLRRALQQANKNTSGGDISEGKHRNVIRTLGQFDNPAKVGETIIAQHDGKPIRVQDVATVGLGYKKPDGVVRQKGIDGLAVNAQQNPGSNLLEVMGPVREELDLNGDGQITPLELAEAKQRFGDSLRIATEELNQGQLRQKGLILEQVYDQTDYLNSATALVTNNIFIGGSLAILVLLVFLRSPRSVLIVGLSIPISVISTFLFMRAFDRSINVISLAGMAFAVGMVVDNAIVVLENIFRHYQKTGDPEESASRGSLEVWGAVLASTLTTLAVFVPVLFVQGQAGQLFRDIAIAISCAVGLSLIVSITVIPTAARRILRARPSGIQKPSQDGGWNLLGLVPLGIWATNGFARFIERLLTMRGSLVVRSLIVALFVVGSVCGAWLLMPETEYLPDGNRNLVIGILLPPSGYNVDQMIRLGDQVEKDIAPYWESRPGSPEEKALEGPRIDNFFFVARGRQLFMGGRSVEPLRAGELVPVFAQAAGKVPGVIPIATQASLFESALSGGRAIDIEITGPDLKILVEEGLKISGRLKKLFPVTDGHFVFPRPSLDLSSPELHVVPRLEKAAELGVTTADLGYTVNALVDGAYAGDYWHEGTKLDLVIFGAEEYARLTQDVGSLPLSTPSGKLVTLSSIARVELSAGPEQVNHSERLRTITLQLKPSADIPLEEALRIVNEKVRIPTLATPAFESGLYQIRIAGTADKLQQTRLDLQWNLVLALVITYLLMAALFESFFYPLVIMTSVVLAMVGGFGGLWVLNLFTPQTLDMLTMLGFVILIGTVVNNAILIVHQTLNNIRIEKMDEHAAIVESVRTRIRPIFMSMLTTVLGMLPLVLPVPGWGGNGLEWVSGAGSELYRGLGSVVLGGLIVSTVFTLVLVPIGFSLALDTKRGFARLLQFPSLFPQSIEFEATPPFRVETPHQSKVTVPENGSSVDDEQETTV
jgi:HAE1 family hydrophobic/amphiphilic exporter-1